MRVSKRARLVLTVEESEHLDQVRQSRTAAIRDVQRARILWRYQAGETVRHIAGAEKTTRKSVLKWIDIDKALQLGVTVGKKDTSHKPREAVTTDDAKSRVVHLACSKPKDPAMRWSYGRARLWPDMRNPALARAGKATVQHILTAQPLQPHKVKYYLEKRDPDFERKMREVLLVYQEVALQNETASKGGPQYTSALARSNPPLLSKTDPGSL